MKTRHTQKLGKQKRKTCVSSTDTLMGVIGIICILGFVLLLMTFHTTAMAKHLHSERYYQDLWCDAMGGHCTMPACIIKSRASD